MNKKILKDNNINKKFRFIGSKAITFYFIVFILANLFLDCGKILHRGRVKALNRMKPNVTHLGGIERGGSIDKNKLENIKFYYKKVVEYLPASTAAYGLLGFCSYHLGDYTEAIEAYKKAIKLEPNFITFYHNLGAIYYEKEDYEKAIYYLKKAVETDLDYNISFVTSTRMYSSFRKDRDELPAQLHAKFMYNYYRTYKLLVSICYQQKKIPETMKYSIDALVSSFPDTTFFFYKIALIAYNDGRYRESTGFLNELLARDPENADALHYLGLSLMALGHKEEGEDALKKAETLYNTTTASSIEEHKSKLLLL